MAKAPEKTRSSFTYTGELPSERVAGVEFSRNKVVTVEGADAIKELRGRPDFYEHNGPAK